mmetsp:Transcript_26877/g.69285  ORF Transcript_26877/g.69285 Transcript_26877/m.69285 type:complete len:324 (+) Transcript_26877:2483-3454(+)
MPGVLRALPSYALTPARRTASAVGAAAARPPPTVTRSPLSMHLCRTWWACLSTSSTSMGLRFSRHSSNTNMITISAITIIVIIIIIISAITIIIIISSSSSKRTGSRALTVSMAVATALVMVMMPWWSWAAVVAAPPPAAAPRRRGQQVKANPPLGGLISSSTSSKRRWMSCKRRAGKRASGSSKPLPPGAVQPPPPPQQQQQQQFLARVQHLAPRLPPMAPSAPETHLRCRRTTQNASASPYLGGIDTVSCKRRRRWRRRGAARILQRPPAMAMMTRLSRRRSRNRSTLELPTTRACCWRLHMSSLQAGAAPNSSRTSSREG